MRHSYYVGEASRGKQMQLNVRENAVKRRAVKGGGGDCKMVYSTSERVHVGGV